MSGILKNVVIKPPVNKRGGDSLFKTISRTDRKHTEEHIRSGPQRCPICGAGKAEFPNLFLLEDENYICTICQTVINSRGEIIDIPAFHD